AQLLFESFTGPNASFQGYKGDNRLPFQLVWPPDNRGFRDLGMRNERTLDFHGAQTMAGHINDVIYPAHDPEITILVFARSVAGKINAVDLRPVLLLIAFVISPDCPDHGGPRFPNHQESARIRRNRLPVASDHVRCDSEKGKSCG